MLWEGARRTTNMLELLFQSGGGNRCFGMDIGGTLRGKDAESLSEIGKGG